MSSSNHESIRPDYSSMKWLAEWSRDHEAKTGVGLRDFQNRLDQIKADMDFEITVRENRRDDGLINGVAEQSPVMEDAERDARRVDKVKKRAEGSGGHEGTILNEQAAKPPESSKSSKQKRPKEKSGFTVTTARKKPQLGAKEMTATQAPSGDLFVSETIGINEYPVSSKLPHWYTSINTNGFLFKNQTKDPSARQAHTAFASMKGCIEKCEKEPKQPQLERLFEELRDHVHKAEITLAVNQYILVKARMLHEESGLPRIFASKKNVPFPWDLKADAWQLYSRWCDGNFEIDLLRGIKTTKGRLRNSDSIDPVWKKKFPAPNDYYGEGKIVLGQWWPTQLCLLRDGVHGASQGGISGEKDRGCFSVVLSGAGESSYQDEDNGDDIWYSGTDGKDFAPTENTLRLIETCDTIKNPVRVIRSSQLSKANPYRPERGLRYDGLYEVTEYRLVDVEKAAYKFHLVRCPGQHPIRCENNAARRPTRFELEEEEKVRGRID